MKTIQSLLVAAVLLCVCAISFASPQLPIADPIYSASQSTVVSFAVVADQVGAIETSPFGGVALMPDDGSACPFDCPARYCDGRWGCFEPPAVATSASQLNGPADRVRT